MHLLTLALLACVPSALLAVKCTDPPDTRTDVVTFEMSTEPSTPAETTPYIPPPESWPRGSVQSSKLSKKVTSTRIQRTTATSTSGPLKLR
ncbi:hypothetical protein PoB_005312800 [Plakobranchus ocellatus]|uniref:Secreted protein n=1 Tax=Plakobranchus ocellatus TaxID=259542 RepID=A0AAV4C6K7_9GAST|nr:hypothetical protein PoB_005312800 [Plakobranchus ocellatus]